MNSVALLLPMFVHVCWVSLLYVLLTIVRAPAIWKLDTKSGAIGRYAAMEPRISANLSNQFEWPLLFYSCCVLVTLTGANDPVQVILAWIFVLGRVIHSGVQILTANIRLRGAVFTINFLAVLCMWARLFLTHSG